MRIPVPRKGQDHEYRPAITPPGTHAPIGRGHRVLDALLAGD